MQSGESIILNLKPEASRGKCPDVVDSFGKIRTDHMSWMEYINTAWQAPSIIARRKIELEPEAFQLNYAGNVFEGQKAMRHADGSVYLIRPHDHANRMNRSFRRMTIPEIDPELSVSIIKTLVGIDHDWVPSQEASFLYIRPNTIPWKPQTGLDPVDEFLFYCYLSPSKPFFGADVNPQALMVTDTFGRAAPGGTGQAKTGGNYAGGLLPKLIAKQNGCIEMLYTRGHVEETNAANFYMVENDSIVTPSIKGSEEVPCTILSGITRDGVKTVSSNLLSIPFIERDIPLEELLSGIDSGKVTEMGLMGTAAVILPIGSLVFNGKRYTLKDQERGPITNNLYTTITGIYSGKLPDTFNWLEKVEKL